MNDDFEWTVLYEGRLLDAMHGHKPVGVNKYFQMAFICDKFAETINKDINPDKVWAHLATMYNLEALDESESIPFPNGEKDFFLPESDFGSLISKKEEDKKATQKGRETPRMGKEASKAEEKPQSSASGGGNSGRVTKETASTRRDSKDSKDSSKSGGSVKKESKKEPENKGKHGKGRPSTAKEKEETKHRRTEESKQVKRPTRGSLKPDDSSSSGKSSPVSTASSTKRRRL